MLEHVMTLHTAMPLHQLRPQLEAFVEAAIGLLDAIDGDPDLEDGNDADLSGDERDVSYTEWASRGRHKLRAGESEASGRDITLVGEDGEDADADTCAAAEDQGTAGGRWFDGDGYPGDSADAEDGHDREQDYAQ